MAIITLTSDYGLTDHYLPALKGAVLRESPDVRLVDVSHTIEPGNFFEAAFILRNSYSEFPKGTVHLVAFSEVTKEGRLLAAEMDGHFFVLADNGLLPMINPEIKIARIMEIDLRQEVSLFPARDVLARSASYLANGGSIGMLGREVHEIKEKTQVRPRIPNDKSAIMGSVVYIDNFGNLITNITRKTFLEVGKERPFTIMLPRNQRVRKLSENYHQAASGSIVALFNSQGLLEIALSGARGKFYNGANSLLGVEVQNSITIMFE